MTNADRPSLREFLESYQLYRSAPIYTDPQLVKLTLPAVQMWCENERGDRTFNSSRKFHEISLKGDNVGALGKVVHAEYVCTSCNQFRRHFLIVIGDDGESLTKVGQAPGWDITLDKTLEEALGESAGFYRNGKISESHAYGIGAFAYYRRVVDEVIDDLVTDIADLLKGEELEVYQSALEDVKKTKVTADKIELVKDLLPPILRPNGINPLSVLHSTISEGLHGLSDEECIRLAEDTREAIEFLVREVSSTRKTSKKFTSAMQRFLERKGGSQTSRADAEQGSEVESSE